MSIITKPLPATPSTLPPLCPLAALPPSAEGLKAQKVLLLVTAVNSFSQRVLAYLQYLEFTDISVQMATSDKAMEEACQSWNPDLVICPFLTRRIPDSVFNHWITLVVHPGPPGDAGPSSLDWVLLGDTGSIEDSGEALTHLLSTSHETWETRQRSHWGTIVFQANEHLDGGSVWAWEQYELPSVGTTTKAGLYQTQHSIAAIYALIMAMIRVYETVSPLPRDKWISARPDPIWEKNSVTHNSPFLGGPTHERPLLQSKMRKPDWSIHTAEDVSRIIYASDSQPGAQLAALSSNSKTSLFAYGAHLHQRVEDVPTTLYTSLGYGNWSEIPNGTIIARRDGAAFFKTKESAIGGAVGVWVTHGRVPKKAGLPLEPKIPMVEAIAASGHGSVLGGVQEWVQETYEEKRGTWQEVYVRTLVEGGKLAQCVYWDFYNGAFSTRQCQSLLKALEWATATSRGNVKILALMGGSYFSNGIALNTIEASTNPAEETWANINAIDDIVEFLLSDTYTNERSAFMEGITPLAERGIVTVACMRGNAAAGGVALAASCDITIASRGVVLNPAYRAMGLHGSEFHSFSYLGRCGPTVAAQMLRGMLPQSSALSYDTGLVDLEIGTATSTRAEIEALSIDEVRKILTASSTTRLRTAPWTRPALTPSASTSASSSSSTLASSSLDLTSAITQAKLAHYAERTTPLLHYRNEELSQMLLDSFHPSRSTRYHERRYKFIRKVKSDATPARYARHVIPAVPDAEDLQSFDDAPGWKRGEEWAWAGLPIPASLASSEWTRIDLYPAGANGAAPAAATNTASPSKGAKARTSHFVEGNGTPPQSQSQEDVKAAASLDPTRKVSTTSALTVSSDSHPTSLNSSDSAPFPLTPPIGHDLSGVTDTAVVHAKGNGNEVKGADGNATLGKQRGSFFRRKSSTPGEDDSSSPTKNESKFRTFGKRFSSAFRIKAEQFPEYSNGNGRGDEGVNGNTIGTFKVKSGSRSRPSVFRAMSSNGASGTEEINGSRTRVSSSTRPATATATATATAPSTLRSRNGHNNGNGPQPQYKHPNVPGADQVEFPCLYDPDSMVTVSEKPRQAVAPV